jgi:hypothetical protein
MDYMFRPLDYVIIRFFIFKDKGPDVDLV